ncbi:YkvI family membrane protein [Bacillus sp. FSL K6-3431]|uniref:YkvI family membrane protein n=1 Tax=Bacillus sp. FSL K6-3431 TaxID=2921500 RepID=UPI0030FA45DB
MKKWTGAFQIAAVYVGTVIGAGFATGKEIVAFFTRFGFHGFLAILLAGYLFIFLGSKIMTKAIEIQATSFEEFNKYLYGKKISGVMNIFTLLMLLGICAVMMAGADALFTEQLGYSKSTGAILTGILAIIVMAVGAKGLFAVNSFVVPALILFSFILMLKSVPTTGYLETFFSVPTTPTPIHTIISAFSYAALNLALAQAVLVPIAVEMNDKATVRLGGIIGGFLLTFVLITSHITLLTLPNFTTFDIPMAVVVKHAASSLYLLYVAVIYGEIFTSVIGNMYGIERQIRKYLRINSLLIYGGILLVVYVIGLVDYGFLLQLLYPLFGYVSLIFLFILALKPTKKA